ncbi:hypothetical protein LCGC14_1879110 [marine sediment metagenome]|uniref:Uncharacterized protein n=1 Tax=marine sediment metagenome TaxID=412755 RepID=A0A0F9GQW4_9ZZZZ
MTAKVYTLDPSSMTWSETDTYENVGTELYRELQALAEFYQGQLIVEYS